MSDASSESKASRGRIRSRSLSPARNRNRSRSRDYSARPNPPVLSESEVDSFVWQHLGALECVDIQQQFAQRRSASLTRAIQQSTFHFPNVFWYPRHQSALKEILATAKPPTAKARASPLESLDLSEYDRVLLQRSENYSRMMFLFDLAARDLNDRKMIGRIVSYTDDLKRQNKELSVKALILYRKRITNLLDAKVKLHKLEMDAHRRLLELTAAELA